MTSRRWVYVAGPYSHPDPLANTRAAVLAGQELWDAGYFPVVPHLSMAWQLVAPQPVEWWYAFDLHLLSRCDALLRLPGESKGADAEVEFARNAGIPAFGSIAELVERTQRVRKMSEAVGA
jgi:nucleoside 2-deoxyribosyltransferase